jgi:hypothetical protein
MLRVIAIGDQQARRATGVASVQYGKESHHTINYDWAETPCHLLLM